MAQNVRSRNDIVAARRQTVARLLRQKISPEAIVTTIQRQHNTPEYNLRTYERDVQFLKKKAREWFSELAQGDFLYAYQQTIESIQEQQRQLSVIAATSGSDFAKIRAREVIIMADQLIINIIADGPMVAALDGKLKKEVAAIQEKVIDVESRAESSQE